MRPLPSWGVLLLCIQVCDEGAYRWPSTMSTLPREQLIHCSRTVIRGSRPGYPDHVPIIVEGVEKRGPRVRSPDLTTTPKSPSRDRQTSDGDQVIGCGNDRRARGAS